MLLDWWCLLFSRCGWRPPARCSSLSVCPLEVSSCLAATTNSRTMSTGKYAQFVAILITKPKLAVCYIWRLLLLAFRDAMLIAVMDVVTSLIAGFVIFTTFGGMAKKIGVDVQDVAKSGTNSYQSNLHTICDSHNPALNNCVYLSNILVLQVMDLLLWRIQKPCHNFRCPSFGPCCSFSCCSR